MKRRNKIVALLLSITLTCALPIGCSKEEKTSEPPVATAAGKELADYSNLYGRTYFSEGNAGYMLYNSASGFEIAFRGTSLAVTWRAAGSWNVYFSVLLDEERDTQADVRTIAVGGLKSVRTVLAEGLPEGEHVIKVLKRTESSKNFIALQKAETDGELLSPPARPSLRLEFYGDSMMCGLGAMRELTEQNGVWTDNPADRADPAMENPMLSYAGVAAELLGAEAQFFGRSGIALRYTNENASVYRNYRSIAVDLPPEETPYDYETFSPDAVVIGLGGNDYRLGRAYPDLGYTSAGLQMYLERFIKEAIGPNYGSDIPIFLVSELMFEPADLKSVMEGVKRDLAAQFPNIITVTFTPCHIDHPVASEHRAAGETLARKIAEKLSLG